MCAKEKFTPEREELISKQLELEDENKFLWEEVKSKRQEVDSLHDKLFLQQDLLKNRVELKKNLNEYQRTIKALQRNLIFLQNENKTLEQKLYQCQVFIKQLQSGDGPDHKHVVRENVSLKLKTHALEKELRRCGLLFSKNQDISADIATARETIMKLEQKLLEYQPLATDCKQSKSLLMETEQKLNSLIYANGVLKDELTQNRATIEEMSARQNEFQEQIAKYIELIGKLRMENASMEKFVEKSFYLEGALAELDDISVILKKQETIMAVLFDENQSLKQGISRLFDDMNEVKERNWKLEKYAADIEDTFYTAEKNVAALEQKIEYYKQIDQDNARMRASIFEMNNQIKYLKNECVQFQKENDGLKRKVDVHVYDVHTLKDDNSKLANENKTLRNTLKTKNLELFRENESLKSELDRQAAELNNFRKLQRQYTNSQDFVHSVREEMKNLIQENNVMKTELEKMNLNILALKADRERYLEELNRISNKYIQLQEELSYRRLEPHEHM